MPITRRHRALLPLGIVTGIAVGARGAAPPAAPVAAVPKSPAPLVDDLRDTDADHAALANLATTATAAENPADRLAAVEQIARVPVASWHARNVLRGLSATDRDAQVRTAAAAALAEVEYEARLRERTPRLAENPYRAALDQVRSQRGVAGLRQTAPQPPAAAPLFRDAAPQAPPAKPAPLPEPPAPERIPAAVAKPRSAPPSLLPLEYRSPPPAAQAETYRTMQPLEPPPATARPSAATLEAIPVAKPPAAPKPPAAAKAMIAPTKIPADPQERRRLASDFLRQGRDKLARGDLDGAEHDAGLARELAVSFGKFEDSPAELERAVSKARGVPADARPRPAAMP